MNIDLYLHVKISDMKSQTYNEIIRELEQKLSDLRVQTQNFIELTEIAIGLCRRDG